MKAAALNAAHIDITLVHERLYIERERLVVDQKRRISANMRPQGLYQLEATANVGDDLWQKGQYLHCHEQDTCE